MRPDFSLIWGADNAPFTPIEASDYTAGWVFRTGAPPRRVNFDYFQNLSDQRTAWLGEQMLLAVGHEWQDDVTYDAYAITRSPVDGQLYRSLVGSNLNNEPSVSGSQWALGVADSVDFLNAPIATVAAASTIDLTAGAPGTSQIAISGTGVSINGFTVATDRFFVVTFAGANTLVNSASLVTRSGANITTASGDSCLMRATAANTVEILTYKKGATVQALTTSGYRVIDDGAGPPLIIQWGTTASIPINSTLAVVFPLAFPNAAFSCLAGGAVNTQNPGAAQQTAMNVFVLSSTGFTVSNDDGPMPARWIAVGW